MFVFAQRQVLRRSAPDTCRRIPSTGESNWCRNRHIAGLPTKSVSARLTWMWEPVAPTSVWPSFTVC